MRRWRDSLAHRPWPGAFQRLDLFEIESVRRQTRLMQRRPLRRFALILNQLSNGALYPLLAVVLIALFGRAMLPAVVIALLSVLIAHLIYPAIKRRCCRARPFECDTSISSLLVPLDKHSFPSGHAMTATAAFLPLSAALPSLSPIAVVAVTLIGWARLAAGHHYPSDIAAGILLGSLIAGPGTLWMLQHYPGA